MQKMETKKREVETEKENNNWAFATTWSYTANIWENIQDGLAENLHSEGLVIPGANWERIKGTLYFYLHSLIINRFLYYFQDLKTHPKEQISKSRKVVSITGFSTNSRFYISLENQFPATVLQIKMHSPDRSPAGASLWKFDFLLHNGLVMLVKVLPRQSLLGHCLSNLT